MYVVLPVLYLFIYGIFIDMLYTITFRSCLQFCKRKFLLLSATPFVPAEDLTHSALA